MSLTVSAALGAHARKDRVFEHKGKKYPLSLVTQEIKVAYADWLASEAQTKLLALRGKIPESLWEERWDKLTDRLASGAFDFHGEAARKSLGTETGTVSMAALLFGASIEEMLQLYAERGAEVNALLKQIFAESTPDWARINLPNDQSPEGKTTPPETMNQETPSAPAG